MKTRTEKAAAKLEALKGKLLDQNFRADEAWLAQVIDAERELCAAQAADKLLFVTAGAKHKLFIVPDAGGRLSGATFEQANTLYCLTDEHGNDLAFFTAEELDSLTNEWTAHRVNTGAARIAREAAAKLAPKVTIDPETGTKSMLVPHSPVTAEERTLINSPEHKAMLQRSFDSGAMADFLKEHRCTIQEQGPFDR